MDLKSLSTEELLRLRDQIRAGAAPAPAPAPQRPLQSMSTEELLRARETGLQAEQNARATQRIAQERVASPTMMAVDDRVRQVARGVPVVGSYLDEASAGLNTLGGLVGDYDQELA
jgi:hypothetical protein